MDRREVLYWVSLVALAAAPSVLLWLPIPNFLWAQGGSTGSGGGSACECGADDCVSWVGAEESGLECGRVGANWKDCDVTSGDTGTCGGAPKTKPLSEWFYDTLDKVNDCNPNSANHDPALTAGVDWKRCVPLKENPSGSAGLTVTFKPKVQLVWSSWDPGNVCGASDADDFIEGYGMAYAALRACGEEWKCDTDKKNGPGGSGRTIDGQNYGDCWAILEFKLHHAAGNWTTTPAIGTEISATFNTKQTCPCSWTNANCGSKRAVQELLRFRAFVDYKTSEVPGDNDWLMIRDNARIVLKAVTDPTNCE